MAKYQSDFHLRRYFLILGALTSIATLGLIVYASQKPTNTQSDAAGGCKMTPQVEYVSSKSEPFRVVYTLRIRNESAKSCGQTLRWISKTKAPDGFYMWYQNHIPYSGGSYYIAFNDLAPQQKQTLKLDASPTAKGVKDGTYYLPVEVCRTTPNCSGGACNKHDVKEMNAYLRGVTDKCTTIKLKYVKD